MYDDDKPLPTLNVELIDRVRAYIAAHPEEHNQDIWGEQTPCGTTFCFAGTAAFLSPNAQLNWAPINDDPDEKYLSTVTDTNSGRRMPVEQFAQNALGLIGEEARVLFLRSYTLDDIDGTLDDIKTGYFR